MVPRLGQSAGPKEAKAAKAKALREARQRAREARAEVAKVETPVKADRQPEVDKCPLPNHPSQSVRPHPVTVWSQQAPHPAP